MKKINIGLIGVGIVGLKRLDNLPKNFNLIGCADPLIFTKKNIHKKKKIFFTKNWKKLINLKNLDSVIVATTHHLHSKILESCIKKNIHTFVEKPAGISDIKTKKLLLKLKKKKI